MKRLTRCLAIYALLAAPTALSGQTVWDAPSFLRPGAPAGLTLALTDHDPGDAFGGLAIWRNANAPVGLGFRAGLSEAPGDEVVGLLGLDVSGSLTGPTGPGSPELMWWTGAGVGLGDMVSASFPLGLVMGWTAREDGISFMPYVGGHMVLDVLFEGDDELDLDGAVDLGLDLGTSDGWVFRFGAALGGREALGIGVTIPR